MAAEATSKPHHDIASQEGATATADKSGQQAQGGARDAAPKGRMAQPRGRRAEIAYIAPEDWFFASHFLPLLKAARESGFEPVVITRVQNHREIIEEAGARLIALNLERRSFNPLAVLTGLLRLAAILRREKVAAVHCITLKSIFLGGLAARLAGVRSRFLAVTGGGLMSARRSLTLTLATRLVRFTILHLIADSRTQFIFENVSDPLDYGLEADAANVILLGGAGVDTDHFVPLPMPDAPELRIAMVSRMLWSKGADIAVKAVQIARSRGCDVRLSLYGAPDPSNPYAIAPETLREWADGEGVEWHGPIADVRQVWERHHLACLPSRGGEGLPRTILEAAACGRAVLTTDVPGCRDFVRHGQEGWLVSVDDAEQLADQMASLWRDRGAVEQAGQRARQRVVDGFTEAAVVEKISKAYRETIIPRS